MVATAGANDADGFLLGKGEYLRLAFRPAGYVETPLRGVEDYATFSNVDMEELLRGAGRGVRRINVYLGVDCL